MGFQGKIGGGAQCLVLALAWPKISGAWAHLRPSISVKDRFKDLSDHLEKCQFTTYRVLCPKRSGNYCKMVYLMQTASQVGDEGLQTLFFIYGWPSVIRDFFCKKGQR